MFAEAITTQLFMESGKGSLQPWTLHDVSKPLGSRPLHLSDGLDDSGHASSSSSSVMVRIFHPQETPNSLHVKVYNTGSILLSSKEQETLLGQVARMLRLSETDEKNVREFERIVSEESKENDYMRNFGGRVFRSPTLFEDMVKCILLCNCQ